MTSDVLGYIADAMSTMKLNYEFLEWTSNIVYPYFVGEYLETPTQSEDGKVESTFILSGYSRGNILELEQAKQTIEAYFNQVYGKTEILSSGNAIAIFYDTGRHVRTVDAELKKIEIYLTIKEWKVNE